MNEWSVMTREDYIRVLEERLAQSHDLGRELYEALKRIAEGEYMEGEAREVLARYEREVTPRMARDEMDEKRERDQRESDRRTEDEIRRQERVDER